MSNRHQRRADLAHFKREAPALLTYLVEPDDAGLDAAPLLQAAAANWLDNLSRRARTCIVCSEWLPNRQQVGALLLAVPATLRPTSASVCPICRACWEADLPVEALERAAGAVLRKVIPRGEFEPLEPRR
ncbi:hypothetical protein [Bradyrhizobium sp. LA6.12]|uniref:hypothetical protein n=1 Tax=unclassified Bradyrhizobium TaxID=2631580 RepID=UPI003393861A